MADPRPLLRSALLAAVLTSGVAPPALAADAAASAPAADSIPLQAPTARPTADDPGLEARMLEITGELRCLVCQNQTIADSHADLAVDLRQEVREMLKRGQTPEQIRRYMTDRYGDFILYRPPLKPSTAVLWLAPAGLLAIALVALGMVIRRRARLADDQFEPEPDLDDAPDPLARPGTPA